MEYLDENSEVELVSQMSRFALRMKKEYGAMVIMLGQLNDKIEQPERISNPYLHYPKKTDIHGSKSVYQIGDNVIIIHRPELLQIKNYGPRHYDTEGIVFFHVLKSRLNGKEGLIRMENKFDEGTLLELKPKHQDPKLFPDKG